MKIYIKYNLNNEPKLLKDNINEIPINIKYLDNMYNMHGIPIHLDTHSQHPSVAYFLINNSKLYFYTLTGRV